MLTDARSIVPLANECPIIHVFIGNKVNQANSQITWPARFTPASQSVHM